MPNHAHAAARDPVALAKDDVGFAARLRDATKSVHREAERTGFIADLIRGRATRAGYALYLRNLVPIYSTLEQRIEVAARGDGPVLASFAAPGLRRLPRLLADLEAIAGGDWPRACPLLPEAENYARAIEAAAADDGRLVAHAYARYLGDLSGGQILKPVLARTLQLEADALTFYDFPAFPDTEIAKRAMRDELDTIDPASFAAMIVVDEAIAAFRYNIDLSLAVTRAAAVPVT